MFADIQGFRQLGGGVIRGKLFRVARSSLIILTPVICVAGFYGAFYGANVVILNHRIHDARSFVYCLLVGPVAALICGFMIWLCFVVPLQLTGWFLGEIFDLLDRLRRAAFSHRAKDPTRR
jgi:hypothetical protein